MNCDNNPQAYNQLDIKGINMTKNIYSTKNKLENFITKARLIHGDRYDYSQTVWVNRNNKLKTKPKFDIICPEHGVFKQRTDSHLNGYGCKKCGSVSHGLKTRKSNSQWIDEAKSVHGNKYDYSKTKYTRNRERVNIVCPEHGEFTQPPDSHLNGYGCKKCGLDSRIGGYNETSALNNPDIPMCIYFIKCTDENETFYKVGLSINPKRRFYKIPYEVELLNVHESTFKECIELEERILNNNKDKHYKPLKKFSGYTECFSELLC